MVWAKSVSKNVLINFVIALPLVMSASKVNAGWSWSASFGATELEKQTSLKSGLYTRPIRRPTG